MSEHDSVHDAASGPASALVGDERIEERFRLLVESVKDYAIFMLDPRGCVATWNAGAERIKGYRAEDILGQHFSRFYPDEDIRAGKCEMELERAARDGRFEDEGWRIRKNGTRFWANVVITALREPDGALVGFAKVTRDLTERRAAEEERLRLGQLARRRIQMLSELSDALATDLSIEEVGRTVARMSTKIADADNCAVYLLDDAGTALELVAELGMDPRGIDRVRSIASGEENPIYAVGVGELEAVWLENGEQYEAFLSPSARLPLADSIQSFWCVPLRAEDRGMGALTLGFRRQQRPSEDEREFVGAFARQCAQALARARRLEAERAAAALAERLRASLATTLRSIGDALIATDERGRITLMNGVAESLTGVTESEARGRPLPEVFRIVNERTREPVPNPVDRVLQTGLIVGLANHTVLLAKDGREIPIDDSGAPIRPEGGAIEGVVLVFRDVSARKVEESRRTFLAEAAQVLTESLDYERTLARLAQLAVPRIADWFVIDFVANDGAGPRPVAIAHPDPSKVSLVEYLHRRYPPDADALVGLPAVLRSGRAALYARIDDEFLNEAGLDHEYATLLRGLGLRSAMIVPLIVRGNVLGALTFAVAESGRSYSEEDLPFAEELAQRCANAIDNARAYGAEQQARRAADVANRAKDEFLAVVSHELRTPLNAIVGWAKMLTSGGLDEKRKSNALETIERNAVAMAQLVEDLLDMSRVISGKLRIDVQQVDVVRVVEAALESIRPAALAKGVELAPVLDQGVPAITGDPTRLQQIVWNLLSNAVKFSARGGRVDLVLRRVGSSLEICVADNGQGIARDFLPKVFEAFRQEDASPSRARGGLGLGLAISKQLAELHGGRIVASSEGEGRGATFTVTLPVSAIAPSENVVQQRVRTFRVDGAFERPAQIRGLRLLVVDDDDDGRALITTILEQCGCRVRTASNVEEALRKFEEEVPDVLLSDIGMPGQDGYDLIRKVRGRPRDAGGDVPAAALTAYARADDRRKMLNAGYSIHLPKPVEPAELVAVVTTLSRFIHRR
jgi:PAS domain S-box-containing protein